MRRPFSCSRPLPEAGKYYRNGPGQIRRVVSICPDGITYQVSNPGPDEVKKHSLSKRGATRSVSMKSFRTWLTHECDREGNIIDHGLSIPTPRTKGKLAAAFRENLENLKKTY